MTSAQHLMGLLTIKTQSINDGRGGIPELDQALAAACCSGMSRRTYVAMRFVYVLDIEMADELIRFLLVRITDIMASKRRKHPRKPGFLRKLCILVLYEVLNPRHCKSLRTRARMIGESKSTLNLWMGIYEELYRDLMTWASIGLDYVVRKAR